MTETPHIPWLAHNYWAESRRPLVSLLFIAPLLVIYELGVLFGNQNGADAWMRQFLDFLGFSQHFLLPILMVCSLLAWHHLSHEPWRFSRGVLGGMAIECLLLAFCLRLIFQVQRALLAIDVYTLDLSIGQACGKAIGFLGAGIYEELLFRLILLSLVVWGFRRSGFKPRLSVVFGVLLSSLIFSAAHYIGAGSDIPNWFTFLFRFLAGVFFSILFLCRGFGIAAGAHAGYDILVGVF